VTRAALAAALLLVLLVAALSGAAVAARPGGTLRMVFISDPPTLDPAHAADLTSSSIIHQVFDALLELDDKNAVIRAQVPTALMILVANIALLYFLM